MSCRLTLIFIWVEEIVLIKQVQTPGGKADFKHFYGIFMHFCSLHSISAIFTSSSLIYIMPSLAVDIHIKIVDGNGHQISMIHLHKEPCLKSFNPLLMGTANGL